MMTSDQKRGQIDFSKLFIIFLFIAGIWCGIEFFKGYFADTKIEQHLTECILKNRTEMVDSVLADAIATELKNRDEIDVDPSKVTIFRSSDGQKINVQVSYIHHIKIPLLDKTWNINFVAKAEEQLNRRP